MDVGEIKLFYYIKPMLCMRVNTLDDFGISENGPDPLLDQPSSSRGASKKRNTTKDADADQARHMAPPFIIETKVRLIRFVVLKLFKSSYFLLVGWRTIPNTL